MRINHNAASFSVFKYYERSNISLQRSMEKLSSGLRIVRPGDDAAGLAISEKFRSQINNANMAVNNVQDIVSYIQTTDGWLQNIHDMINRMSELAVEARDGTKSAADRLNLQTEFTEIQKEISAITTGTSSRGKYNTLALFQNSARTIQVGPDYNQTFSLTAIDLQSSGGTTMWQYLFTIGISTETKAGSAISITAQNIIDLATKRATLGAEQNRLEYTMEGLRNYTENISKAESIIRDVDVANETTKFTRHQILVQTGTAMLAQANAVPQSVLALIGGR